MAKKTKPRLAEPTGELVPVVTFSAAEIEGLRDALRGRVRAEKVPAVVESLRECCELGGVLLRAARDAESAPEIKAALDNITAHARALSGAIMQAEGGTSCALQEIARAAFADWFAIDVLADRLALLAEAADGYRAGLPLSFETARAPVAQVEMIHQTLQKHGVSIRPSRAPSSKFRSIAWICLPRMGYTNPKGKARCPDYPISEYLKKLS